MTSCLIPLVLLQREERSDGKAFLFSGRKILGNFSSNTSFLSIDVSIDVSLETDRYEHDIIY